MRQLGQFPTEDDLEAMMDEFDTDGNGVIDFEEFCCLMTRQAEEVSDDNELVGADEMVRAAARKAIRQREARE